MDITTVKIETVIPYARNPRKNEAAIDKVAASIKEFGFRSPIIVDKEMVIIAGHTRLAASQKLGLQYVPVHIATGLTPAQVKAYRLADNRTAQDAEWDNDLLKLELEDLQDFNFDLDLTGFSDVELNALLNPVDLGTAMEEDEGAGVLPSDPVAKEGDIWILGTHRLMCGNSEEPTALGKLMNNKKADLVFTDPPYNLAGESNKFSSSNLRKSYKNLEESEWDRNFKVEPFLNASLAFLTDNASVFVCTSHHLFGDIIKWMREALSYANYCVWCKPNPMPSLHKRRFTWATELICYGTREGHTFNFPAEGHALNYLVETSPSHTTPHPTEKPLVVPAHYIYLTSKPNDNVLDLFGGSGTTLIACEKLKRNCFMMELSPAYCDVIIERFQKLTNQKACLESTGELYDDLLAIKR